MRRSCRPMFGRSLARRVSQRWRRVGRRGSWLAFISSTIASASARSNLPQLEGGAAHAGEVAALQRGAQPRVRPALDRHEHMFAYAGGHHQSHTPRLHNGGRALQRAPARLTAPPPMVSDTSASRAARRASRALRSVVSFQRARSPSAVHRLPVRSGRFAPVADTHICTCGCGWYTAGPWRRV